MLAPIIVDRLAHSLNAFLLTCFLAIDARVRLSFLFTAGATPSGAANNFINLAHSFMCQTITSVLMPAATALPNIFAVPLLSARLE